MSRTLMALLLAAAGAATAAEKLEDPMVPPREGASKAAPARSVPQRPRLYLSSTVISGERRVAVVNGRQLMVGESIAGARVIDITPTRVRLRWSGQNITLRLNPYSVKRPAR